MMSSLSNRLLETIQKDIEELKLNLQNIEKKVLRKECNLLKSRIDSLSKLKLVDQKTIDKLQKDIESLLI